jgi:hypothetical protein
MRRRIIKERAMPDSEQDDAQSAMLGLSVALEKKAAAGHRLSPDEQVINDVVWIDVQCAPNGLDGWLCYTSNEQMRRTLDAVAAVGCPQIAKLLEAAMAVAAIDPAVDMSDDEREQRLDALGDADQDRLAELEDELFDATPQLMDRCRAFARSRGL